jgi:DNA-binding CsgD family transcriptional regulator
VSAALAEMDDGYQPFCSLFDGSSTCIAQLDLQLRIIDGSAGFAEVFGLEVGTLPGHRLTELVHLSVREKLSRQLRSLAHGERSRFTDRIVASIGARTFSAELTGIAVTNDVGRVDSLIVLVQREGTENGPAIRPVRTRKPLTKMDALVLEGVASGMSTVQLAANLFLSRGGVEYHVSALMKSLKATNRSALVSKAYSAGLFSVGSWPPRVIADFVE